MADTDDALRRFRASMILNFDVWHDGIPYDLDALMALPEAERSAIGCELAAKGELDWRDVQALERIGTPEALARIAAAAGAQADHGGASALRAAASDGWPREREDRFIALLEAARPMETSFDTLFDVAEAHPTPRVRAKLLELATGGAPETRYAFGAFLLYLHGQAEDWYGLDTEHRPHLLGLSDSGAARAGAEAWLRNMIASPIHTREDAR